MTLIEEISVTQVLVTLTIAGILTRVLFKTSEPYNRFRRVGLPWYLSFFPSKPVHELVEDGYRESKEPFVVRWWAVDWLVLGAQHLADLKHCESSSLSFLRVISDALFLGHSVGNLYHGDKMADVIKRGMNTQLSALTPIMIDEIGNAFENHVGKVKEWQEILVADTISDLTNQVACRVLICRELSRNADFLRLSMKFQHSIFLHAMAIISLPLGPLRGIFSRLITLSHRWNLRKTVSVLQPIVTRRIIERYRGRSEERQNDGIEWTLDLTAKRHMKSYRLSLEIIHNLFAGSLTPGALVTEMLFQALMDPKLIRDLRKEAEEALAEHGWTDKLLRRLLLQDSFIRELSRVYPTGATGCSRLVVDETFTFSDGLTVPKGTRLTFPIRAIMEENNKLENPTKFDAYRFLRLRDSSGDDEITEYQWAASNSSPANLMFGYGKHACPGRYYGVRQAKLIFTKLIVEYDLEWPVAGTKRPQRETIEGQFGPNRSQKIRLRSRVSNE